MKHNFLKFLLAGMVLLGTSINLWAYDGTFYCVPKAMWGDDWSSSKTVKLNVRRGDGNDNWVQQTMSGTGRYYKGNEIYSTTVTTFWYDYCGNVQFQRYNGSTQEHSWEAYGEWKELSYFNSRLFPGNAGWQDYKTDPVFNYAHLYYKIDNGTEQNYKFDGNKDEFNLGTITSAFTITNMYLNYSKNDGNICNGHMGYKIDNGSNQSLKPDSWTWKEGGGEMQWKNANYELINAEQNSGKHTLTIWWAINGGWAGNTTACNDNTWYYSNSGNNYTWKYTILPPAISTFSVAGSGDDVLGGSGTQDDPYLIKKGGSITLTPSGTAAHSDANSKIYVSYNGGSIISTAQTFTNLTTDGSISCVGEYYNKDAKLHGTGDKITYVVYYKIASTQLYFDRQNGTASIYQTIYYGENPNLADEAKNTTKTGYNLNNYWTDPTNGTQITQVSGSYLKFVNSSIDGWLSSGKWASTDEKKTIYAHWTPKTATIVLKPNYEGCTQEDVTFTATYGQVSPYNSGTTPLHTRTGYSMKAANGKNGYWKDASDESITTDRLLTQEGMFVSERTDWTGQSREWMRDTHGDTYTFYAHWQPNAYTITLDNESATTPGTESISVTYDSNNNLTSAITKPTKTDKVFAGYYTEKNGAGMQLIDAGGNIVSDGHYITGGNWTYANNLKLYAKWDDPVGYTITFGQSDGSIIVSRGTLVATVDGTQISSGDKVYNGKTVVLTFTSNKGQKTGTTDYDAFAVTKWTSDIEGSSFVSGAPNTYEFTVINETSVYAQVRYIRYPFTMDTNPSVGGIVTCDKDQNAGPDKGRTLTATENPGYSFTDWTLPTGAVLYDNTNVTDKQIKVMLVSAPATNFTANFTPITYTITYHPNNGDENFNEHYTIEAAHTLANAPTYTNYSFDGWFDNEGCTGTAVTQIPAGSHENKEYWAKWHETTHPVTIQTSTGIESVSPSSVTVGAITASENITATVADGYTWATWQATTGITAESMMANPIQINAFQNGTLTATATENLATLTASVNANSTDMGTVKLDGEDVLTKQIGVATTATLTASSVNRNYKFKQWALTNCTITNDKTINDAEITVKGDGTNAATAVAEFEVAWYVCGADADIFVGWGSNGHKLTKMDGVDKFTYTINVQKIATGDTDFEFKVYNFNQNKYYDYENFWFTRENYYSTLYTHENQTTNMKLRSDMVGDYVFTLDCTSSRETPILTVTFPGETSKTVIVNTGETETQMDVKDVTPTPIEAPEYLEGLRFDKWVVSGGEISIANQYDHNTTIHGATTDNVTVTATFTTNGMIYFNNSGSWWNSGNSDVYVYLFDNTEGVWWNDEAANGGVHPKLHRIEFSKMERIPNTQIYYYRYTCNSSDIKGVAFSKDDQHNNEALYQTSAAWRTDFKAAKGTMYMASKDYATKNSTGYHSYGYWKYYHVTDSKFYLQTYEGEQAKITTDHFVNTDESSSIYTMTYHFTEAKEYQFKLRSDNGGYFGNNGKIESSVKGWEMQDENYEGYKFPNCKLNVTVAGDYNFTLDLSSAPMRLSVEYPLSEGDYRVKYTDKNSNVLYSDYIKKVNGEKQDIVSFYVGSDYQGTLQLQHCTGFTSNTPNWEEVGGKTLDVSSITNNGAYLFYVNQTNGTDGGVTLENPNIKYSGDYYVRSKGAGTDIDYLQAKMTHFDSNPNYDYYFCKWVGSDGADVSFCIANDYNSNLTQKLIGDAVATGGTLPKKANVRYAWNEKTNTLSRAYLTGSNEGEDFLYISAEAGKLYDLDDAEVTKVNFTDKFDWVYQLDVKAGNGATVDVIATYNSKPVTLVDNRLIFSTTGADDSKAQMNLVYDFKTNRIVAAWRPSGEITSQYTINTDIMLMRNGQAQADQMKFSGSGEITGEPKTVYGAVQFDKSLMALEDDHGYQKYDRSIFWISFPFDVRLNDVFGLGQYGKYWIIRYYDGAERASKGWFQETKTFWKTVSVEEREHGGSDGKGFILNANEGYNLVLDYTAVLKDLYPNGATENYLFFPSKEKISNISELKDKSITYDPLTCTITSPEDRTNEDSNWRVIGVPSYADPGAITLADGIKFYYAWDRTHNTLGVEKTEDNPRGGSNTGTFQSMHAYMVQFAGTIDWSEAVPVSPATAPLFANNEKEEYSLRLELQQEGKKVDQAYVDLTDDATENFDLNLDITKLMYSTSQIYSFIGNDKVAANSLPVRDVVVPLCVTAAADGTYTIALPGGTEGLNVTLYDVTAGKETNMSFDGYTVNLDKGEYNNRFLLNISVPRVPTNIQNANGEWNADGKTKKLFINDNIYLINAGRIYNATGTKVK